MGFRGTRFSDTNIVGIYKVRMFNTHHNLQLLYTGLLNISQLRNHLDKQVQDE